MRGDACFTRTVIACLLIDAALLQKKPKELIRRPDDKKKLRSFINQKKEARSTGSKQEKADFSKLIQKEIKVIEKARRTIKVQKILEQFCDLKRLEKTRTRKASVLIGSIRAANGDIKKDRLDIANAFAEFYKTLYADARKILDTISTRGQDALDDIADISQSEVAEQFKKMRKGRAPTTRGL